MGSLELCQFRSAESAAARSLDKMLPSLHLGSCRCQSAPAARFLALELPWRYCGPRTQPQRPRPLAQHDPSCRCSTQLDGGLWAPRHSQASRQQQPSPRRSKTYEEKYVYIYIYLEFGGIVLCWASNIRIALGFRLLQHTDQEFPAGPWLKNSIKRCSAKNQKKCKAIVFSRSPIAQLWEFVY